MPVSFTDVSASDPATGTPQTTGTPRSTPTPRGTRPLHPWPRWPPWPRWLRRKNWDDHVSHLEDMAQTDGFQALRDRIVERADLRASDRVVDVGAGTGLLALAAARRCEQVWAIDISPAMCRVLKAKAAARSVRNLTVVKASAMRLPLPDDSVDAVVSNYCYHHLNDGDKLVALTEARRVLRPGGRLVLGDMMFRVRVNDSRDREIIARLVVKMLRRGPAGVLRIAKNALRYLTGRWEHPADAEWWASALAQTGFEDVEVLPLDHEGGIALARIAPETQERRAA